MLGIEAGRGRMKRFVGGWLYDHLKVHMCMYREVVAMWKQRGETSLVVSALLTVERRMYLLHDAASDLRIGIV